MVSWVVAGLAGVPLLFYFLPVLAMGTSSPERIAIGFFLIAGIILAMFVHLVVHEIGHLLFGLFTGYKFYLLALLFWRW